MKFDNDMQTGGFIGWICTWPIMLGCWMSEVGGLRSEAIKRGFAEYSQENGQWQWKKTPTSVGDEKPEDLSKNKRP